MKNHSFISTSIVLGTLLTVVGSGVGAAEISGYVVDSRGAPIKSGAGLCWRTGYWTPAMATQDCDADLAKTKVAEKIAIQKPTSKETVPLAIAPKPESLSVSADGLFAFGKATLLSEKKPELDLIAKKLSSAKFSKITVTGHTDRLGSKKGNLKLSKDRADAVKAYLVSKGVDRSRIVTVGKGSAEPKTVSGQCKGKKNPKLIACLQPDRRVEITGTP